jgi:hypothetical protein
VTASDTAPASPGPGRAPRRSWYHDPWLYLVLALLVAIFAVVWAAERAEQGVRSNLDARLRDAGAGTDAALVALEAEQLSALRAITFTKGVAAAVANRRIKTLNRLVAPLQANSTVPMVDVVLPDGRVLLAVRSRGAPAPVADRAGMPGLEQAVAQARGRRGGRFSELVTFRSGPTLVTLGPLLQGTLPVGVVLCMTPLADALGRFSQDVGANLTAYDAKGDPIATTASFQPRPLDPSLARGLVGGGAIVMRYVWGDYREAVGRLILDHQPVAVLGVSLPDNSSVTGHAVGLYAGLGLIGLVLVLGAFSVRRERGRR